MDLTLTRDERDALMMLLCLPRSEDAGLTQDEVQHLERVKAKLIPADTR